MPDLEKEYQITKGLQDYGLGLERFQNVCHYHLDLVSIWLSA